MMEEDKALVVKKESILDRLINFFKNIFKKENASAKQEPEVETITQQEETEEKENYILNSLSEDLNTVSDIAKLKQDYIDGVVKIDDISDEDLKKLDDFYDRQNADLRREIDQKKIKIGMLKVKLIKAEN